MVFLEVNVSLGAACTDIERPLPEALCFRLVPVESESVLDGSDNVAGWELAGGAVVQSSPNHRVDCVLWSIEDVGGKFKSVQSDGNGWTGGFRLGSGSREKRRIMGFQRARSSRLEVGGGRTLDAVFIAPARACLILW